VPMLGTTLLGRGIHLKMPWPNDPPPAGTLQLSVRYQPPHGPALTARRAIRIDAGYGSEFEKEPLTTARSNRSSTNPASPLAAPISLVPSQSVATDQLLTEQATRPPAAPHLGPAMRAGRGTKRSGAATPPHSRFPRAAQPRPAPAWQPFR
jgi:hypothetical protein